MSTPPLKVRLIIPIDWRKAVLPELRKVVTFDEDIYIEGERASDPCLLYTSPSPRDATLSRMPSSA